MAKRKLKPCKCGCEVMRSTDLFRVGLGKWCWMVVCENIHCCEFPVLASSYFKSIARLKAEKEWNRRADNG